MTHHYASKEDMIQTYGESTLIELTDRNGDGVLDGGVLTRALMDAAALIDAFVSRRYDPVHAYGAPVLREHCAAIAYYKLHRGHYPDPVRVAYQDGLDFLRGLARGEVNLDISGASAPSAPADARVEAPERMFNRDSLKGL